MDNHESSPASFGQQDSKAGLKSCTELASATRALFSLAKVDWGKGFETRRRNGDHDEDALWWDVSIRADGCLLMQGVDGHLLLGQNRVQGVLLIDRVPKPSRSLPSRPIQYVRYLATAPWNRHGRMMFPILAGIGKMLVETVTKISLDADCSGWIGLHSLRAAESFYVRHGLKDFGSDPTHHGLRYFEGVSESVAFQNDMLHDEKRL